jgi:molecular chaperone GrpE
MSDQNSENSGPNDRVEPSFSSTDGSQPDAMPAESVSNDPAATTSGQASDAAADGGMPPISAVEPDPAVDPAAQIAELEASLNDAKERHLRAVAEMENVRRRAAEDVSKAHKFSIESFAETLLPVKDSLEMALKVETPTVESLQEGAEATLRQLTGAFEKNQLIEIDPLGQKFDPNHHQAISMVPQSACNPPVEANHVASVLQKGYLINDRVLRPALVTVAEP